MLSAVLLAGFLALVAAFALPSVAGAFTAGPNVTFGSEQTVFDYRSESGGGFLDACETWDIPDQPSRAFRDDQNRVHLHFDIAPNRVYRNIGSSLDDASKSVTAGQGPRHDCSGGPGVAISGGQPDPTLFDQYEWLTSMYTIDGHTIYSLAHEEWRGWQVPEPWYCPLLPDNDTTKCWYNALVLYTSTNSGDWFDRYPCCPPPTHLVATVPYQWVNHTGPYGTFSPSNIVAKRDPATNTQYYYNIFRAKAPGQATWHMPHAHDEPGLAHVVARVGRVLVQRADDQSVRRDSVEPIRAHVRRHRLRHRDNGSLREPHLQHVLRQVDDHGRVRRPTPGFYFALSDDLIHWTSPRLLMGRATQQSYTCGNEDPVRDPSVLDPSATVDSNGQPSRNFETVDQDAYLYYKIFRLQGGCTFGDNRDLQRIPLHFTGTVPVASFTSSSSPALLGNSLTLNASGTSDPGGNPITAYDWDVDGDGYYETTTGSNPVYTFSPFRVQTGKVGLRVTDSEGLQDIVHKRIHIDAKMNMQPTNVVIPSTYGRDDGDAYNDVFAYGWVRQDTLGNATPTPLDLTANTIDRDRIDTDSYSQEQDTLLFMQYPTDGNKKKANRTPGAWQMEVPCGAYSVTVSVGDSRYRPNSQDPADSSVHQINIEGETAISGFVPTSTTRFKTATRTVPVCDGHLTIDAVGGTNTKLNYVNISRVDPAKINFQPAIEPQESGYANGTGAAYSNTRGYGWVRQDSLSSNTHTPLDLTANARDRDHEDIDSFSQKLDTFVFMQYPTNGFIQTAVRTPGAWEMALPCGHYDVTVSVGDSRYRPTSTDPGDSSVHRINIEGTNAISGFTPTSANRFQTATRSVKVCDGRLTIDAIGGTNTKLNYVEVATVTAGP